MELSNYTDMDIRADITVPFSFGNEEMTVRKKKKKKKWKVNHELWGVSLPKRNTHCTGRGKGERAVNKIRQLFSVSEQEAKLFQSPLKGCFQNMHIGSVGRDKRAVPRRLCGDITHTEQAGITARLWWQCQGTAVVSDPNCQGHSSPYIWQNTALYKTPP